MWLKYKRNSGHTEPRFFKLLTVIGELKTVHPSLLSTVKNATTLKTFTKSMIDSLLTDKVLELTESGSVKLAGKALELFKYHKYPYKHFQRNPSDSTEPHSLAVKSFLYHLMFSENYHSCFYANLDDHALRPDACVVFAGEGWYQLKFVEVEETDKDEQYLIDKCKKYISAGRTKSTWESWWKHQCDRLELPHCTQEEFKFSVLCKGKKTFDREGWEWQ